MVDYGRLPYAAQARRCVRLELEVNCYSTDGQRWGPFGVPVSTSPLPALAALGDRSSSPHLYSSLPPGA